MDRTEDVILKEIIQVGQDLTTMQKEIETKKEQLDEAKRSNVRLLAQNAGKTRKPSSLKTQAENIRNLEIELNQLRDTIPILQEKEAALASKHLIAKSQRKIDQNYRPKAESFSKKIDEIFRLLKTTVTNMNQLGTLISEAREENPLSELNGILTKIENGPQYEKLNLPSLERYRFLSKVVPLEKELKQLPKIVSNFSDLAFGLEQFGLKNLKVPRQRTGPVPVSRGGTRGYVVGNDVETKKLNRLLGVG